MAREVGIKINVIDGASGALRVIAGSFKGVVSALGDVRKDIAGAFSLANVTRGVTAGARMIQQGFREAAQTVGELTAASMEFRKEGDPVLEWFQATQLEAQRVKARLGDVLIPVLMAVQQAFSAGVGSISQWLKANREMLAMKVAEYVQKIATVLVNGIANGALLAARAWHGWKMAIAAVKAVLDVFVARALSGIKSVLDSIANTVGAFDSDLGDSIRAAATDAGRLGDEFDKNATTQEEAIATQVEALDELERKILAVAGAVVTSTQKIGRFTAKNLATTAAGGDQLVKTELAAAAKRAAQIKWVNDLYAKSNKERLDSQLAYQMAVDAMQQKDAKDFAAAQEEKAQAFANVVDQMSGAFAQHVEQVIRGEESIEAAFGRVALAALAMTIDIVTKQIIAEAALAAVKAYRNAQEIPVPFLGLALGAAAAATAFKVASSYASKFAEGGEVTGGVAGRDSVPALLTPGEVVLTVAQARAFRSLLGTDINRNPTTFGNGVVAMQSGGTVGPGGGRPSQVNVVVNSQTLAIGTRAERKRALASMARELSDTVSQFGLTARGYA